MFWSPSLLSFLSLWVGEEENTRIQIITLRLSLHRRLGDNLGPALDGTEPLSQIPSALSSCPGSPWQAVVCPQSNGVLIHPGSLGFVLPLPRPPGWGDSSRELGWAHVEGWKEMMQFHLFNCMLSPSSISDSRVCALTAEPLSLESEC